MRELCRRFAAYAHQTGGVHVEEVNEHSHLKNDMSKIFLKVNGHLHTLDVDPTTPLLFVLADELGFESKRQAA